MFSPCLRFLAMLSLDCVCISVRVHPFAEDSFNASHCFPALSYRSIAIQDNDFQENEPFYLFRRCLGTAHLFQAVLPQLFALQEDYAPEEQYTRGYGDL